MRISSRLFWGVLCVVAMTNACSRSTPPPSLYCHIHTLPDNPWMRALISFEGNGSTATLVFIPKGAEPWHIVGTMSETAFDGKTETETASDGKTESGFTKVHIDRLNGAISMDDIGGKFTPRHYVGLCERETKMF